MTYPVPIVMADVVPYYLSRCGSHSGYFNRRFDRWYDRRFRGDLRSRDDDNLDYWPAEKHT